MQCNAHSVIERNERTIWKFLLRCQYYMDPSTHARRNQSRGRGSTTLALDSPRPSVRPSATVNPAMGPERGRPAGSTPTGGPAAWRHGQSMANSTRACTPGSRQMRALLYLPARTGRQASAGHPARATHEAGPLALGVLVSPWATGLLTPNKNVVASAKFNNTAKPFDTS